jgi:hypothetical protein
LAKLFKMKKTIILVLSIIFIVSCEVDNTVFLKPTVITYEPENILTNSFKLEGETLGEGGLVISEYGAVWSTSFPPTINDNKSIEGERLGFFSNTYANLEANTTYYCSAYAINAEGVGYGNIWEFTTSAEAPCEPQNNYFEAQTNLNMTNGNYTSTNVVTESTYFGGDYFMKAQKGFISDYIEVQVHFDGSFENLLSGAYPIVSDLDFAFQRPNKAAVLVRYSGSFFTPVDGGTVYIERSGNEVFITLCDLQISGSINYNQYEAIITTKYQVSQ